MKELKQTKPGPWTKLHRMCLSCGESTSGTMEDLNNKKREKFALWDHYEHLDSTNVQALFCFKCGTINNVTITQASDGRYQIVYLEDDDGCFYYKSMPSDLDNYFTQNFKDPDLKLFFESRAFERMRIHGFLPPVPKGKMPFKSRRKSGSEIRTNAGQSDIDRFLGQPSTISEFIEAKSEVLREQSEPLGKWKDRKTAILWLSGILSLFWLNPLDDAFIGFAKVMLGGVFITGMTTIVILEAFSDDELPTWTKTLITLAFVYVAMSGLVAA